MQGDRTIRTLLALSTGLMVIAALYYGRVVFAPVACALFIIAIAWPVQSILQRRMPKIVALLATIFVILLFLATLVSMIVWSFSRVAQWLVSNASRFQTLYMEATAWLEGHGIVPQALIAESFSVGWLLSTLHIVAGQVHGMVTFTFIAAIFVVLGLLEVDDTKGALERLNNREIARSLQQAGAEIAEKFQKYMAVRTLISIATGIVVGGFTLVAGLELATAWGVIGFVLNYIPFLGPLIATVFPTLFALAQSESWQVALTVFIGLNIIQFLLGSYLEPRIAGSALALSPFVVLLAIFIWSMLWGLAGAFIGIPIVIAVVTVCAQHDATRWIAVVLSGAPDPATKR
jgi:predicted PurR-regulated permease PerM